MPTVSRLFLKREMSKDVLRPTRSKETNSGPVSGYFLLIFEERNHTKPSQDLFLIMLCINSEITWFLSFFGWSLDRFFPNVCNKYCSMTSVKSYYKSLFKIQTKLSYVHWKNVQQLLADCLFDRFFGENMKFQMDTYYGLKLSLLVSIRWYYLNCWNIIISILYQMGLVL